MKNKFRLKFLFSAETFFRISTNPTFLRLSLRRRGFQPKLFCFCFNFYFLKLFYCSIRLLTIFPRNFLPVSFVAFLVLRVFPGCLFLNENLFLIYHKFLQVFFTTLTFSKETIPAAVVWKLQHWSNLPVRLKIIFI